MNLFLDKVDIYTLQSIYKVIARYRETDGKSNGDIDRPRGSEADKSHARLKKARQPDMEAITQSMLGMFFRSAHQFERRPLRGEIIPPGIAARRGSATHKAAPLNHEQKLHTQEDLPLDHLKDAARDHYVQLIQEEGVFIPQEQLGAKDQLLAGGLDAAVRLTKLYRESLAPAIQPALVEEKLTMDVGLDLPLQGTIAVLTQNHWLPDLKHADKSKNAGEADHSLQLTFYAGLVAPHTGRWPQRLSLEILVNTKEPKVKSLPPPR